MKGIKRKRAIFLLCYVAGKTLLFLPLAAGSLRSSRIASSSDGSPKIMERKLPCSDNLFDIESNFEYSTARSRHNSGPVERNVFVHHKSNSTSPSDNPVTSPSMVPTAKEITETSKPSSASTITSDPSESPPTAFPTTMENKTTEPTSINNLKNSIFPTQGPSSDMNVSSIDEFLTETLPDSVDLFLAGSPQNMALNQLLNTSSQLDPNDIDDQFEIIQRYALNTLYFSTDGDKWKFNNGWTSGSNPCGIKDMNNNVEDAWFGVLCSDDLKVVEKLTLDNNTLRGSLPSEIKGLAGLIRLDVSNNQISGSLSEWIGELQDLSVLDVGTNFFTGEIPQAVESLTSLLLLDVSSNFFSGILPKELGQLTNLISFHVDSNFIRGAIPPELFDATKLVSLRIDNNQLTGSIPTEISKLSNAIFLSLSKNSLSGTIPEMLGELQQMELFNATANFIGGNLPDIFDDLVYLKSFEMALNFLTGTLPETLLHNTSVLENLNLAGNALGEAFFLPDGIGQMTALQSLDLSTNQFVGPIPDAIGGMTSLRELRLDKNFLTGEVPVDITKLADLEVLSLSENTLTKLPLGLTNLKKLRELQLSTNSFDEIRQEYLTELPNLETFNISKNLVKGDPFPEQFLSSNLITLDFSFNFLNTSFNFASMAGLKRIKFMHMADCSISSNLDDDTISTLQSLVTLDFDGNFLAGTIPPSLGNIISIQKIFLGSNDLTGTIPSELGQLSNLAILELQFNSLTGTVPTEFDMLIDATFNFTGNFVST